MLTLSQKQAIAGTLSTGNLAHAIDRINRTMQELGDSSLAVEASAFARSIDKHYRKRDGFVPHVVIKLINGQSAGVV